MNEMAVHPSAYLFFGLAVGGALLAVLVRNILHAIFGLAIMLTAVAVLFVYLGSPFVAAMQILIYVGGITVAMVFAVMLAYSLGASPDRSTRWRWALLPVLPFFAVIAGVLRLTSFESVAKPGDGSVAAIGHALLTHYNVVFEALSVVLLLAIIGAILIARKEPEPEPEPGGEPEQ